MNLRDTTKQDVEFVKEHSVSRGVLGKQPERIDYCYTLEDEGKILGIGGISLITPTTCWCWFDATEYVKEHWKTAYRVISEYLEILMKEKGIIRAQAYVGSDFPAAVRTVVHLGFHRESLMPNFVGKKPAYLYVRFFDGISDDKRNKQE